MQSPFQFLIEAIFNLYLMVILLRFLMQLFRVDFYNPLSQFIVKATNPVLIPLRKVIPGLGGIDIASLVFAYLVVLLKVIILFSLIYPNMPTVPKLLMIGLIQLVEQCFSIIFYLVLIRVILSWVNPTFNNPMVAVIYQLTEPLMAPARRLLPSMGGLDLSPILLLLALQFMQIAIQSWFLMPIYQSI
jgi:YggT family protein